MSLKRTTAFLIACGLAFGLAAPASAQIGDMQLFAPANLEGFGGGIRPTEGPFITYDALLWSVSQPEARPIGTMRGYRSNYNLESTAFIDSHMEWGSRIEAGKVWEHNGLLFSFFHLQPHNNTRTVSGTSVVFGQNFLSFQPDDPDAPYLLYATDFQARNELDTWGIELEYLRRSHPLHNGGMIEVFGGVRYLEFNERFSVTANRATAGDDDEDGPTLDRNWSTSSQNHLIGPQLGLRWFRQWSRWQASSEIRYFAGFNSQNFHQQGQIDVLDNLVISRGSFNSVEYDSEFCHTVELRIELKYQVTRAIFFKVGWTGMWMDRIARAPNMVSYDDPINGVAINPLRHQEDVFLNGLNIGVTLNR